MSTDEKPFRIFVVEDNEWYNRLLVHNLSLNPDYEVVSFFNGADCLKQLHQNPDVITLDYRLPDMNGMEVLRKIRERNEDIQVILISEQEEIEVVVDLLKLGAYDYIVKSNDIRERLLNTVQNIRKQVLLTDELKSLRKEVNRKYSFENTIIGNSPATRKIFDLIEKSTRTNITVSVTARPEQVNELVAKSIHYNSVRKDKPFVAVNVAAIPSELVESELFGHEKGAFTGAIARRIGRFEEADGGTLFLDEIAEMDLTFQAKCYRRTEREKSGFGALNRENRLPHYCGGPIKTCWTRGKPEIQAGSQLSVVWASDRSAPVGERGNALWFGRGHFMDDFVAETNGDKKN
jgi:DNA-binding NtrC family response regulator